MIIRFALSTRVVVFCLALAIVSPVILGAVGFQTGKLYGVDGQAGLPGFNAGLVAGDFDGDGRMDFAVSVNQGAQISIMRTGSDGRIKLIQELQTGLSFSSAAFPFLSSMAVGDFNGDGHLDIAFSLQSDPQGQSLEVFVNDGTGHFSAPVVVESGLVIDRMVSGDFNRDGRSELAVLARRPADSQNSVLVLGLKPGGLWTQLQVISVEGSGALVAGDFNGDGSLDLLVGNESLAFGQRPPQPTPPGDLLLIPGSAKGIFGEPEVVAHSVGYVSQAGVADLNHDGRLDLILSVFTATNEPETNCQPQEPQIFGNCFWVPKHKLMVFLGSASKSGGSRGVELFHQVAEYSRPERDSETPILVADLNNDGEIDLSEEGDVLLGDGTGHFKRVAAYAPAALAVADVDGDGKSDLVTSLNEDLVVMSGNGNGTFQGPVALPSDIASATRLDGGYVAAATADFNGDGNPDIAMYALNDIDQVGQPTHLLIYLNQGNGVFGEPTSVINGSASTDVVIFGHGSDLLAADFNTDGNTDLVTIGGGSNIVTFFPGNGAGKFGSGSQSQVGNFLGSATVQDFNQDGIPDIAVIEAQNSSHFLYALVGNGDGTFNNSSTVSIPGSLENIQAGDFLHSGGDDRHAIGNDVATLSCPQGQGNCDVNVFSSLSASGPQTINIATDFGFATVLATGDFNHDGYMDIVIGGFGSDFGNALTVYLGDGNGHFVAHQVFACSTAVGSVCPAAALQLVVADFNGDGHLDLLTDNYDFYRGNGDGTFTPGGHFNVFPIEPDFEYSREMHVADVNGDGAPDIIATPGYVLYNAGGTFITMKTPESAVDFHQPVTIKAFVKPGLKGTGEPSGRVEFYDDSALPARKIGTGVIDGGESSVMVSDLSTGTHMIRARYLGDGNFNPHDGLGAPLTVTDPGTGQARGGGQGELSQGGSSNGGSCSTKAHAEKFVQTARAIKPVQHEVRGYTPVPQGSSGVRHPGDLHLKKPRVPGGPVPPIGDWKTSITGTSDAVGFDGLTNLDSLLAGGSPSSQRSVEPSDQALAVSGTQVMQAVNSAMAVYSKDGKLLSNPKALNEVFGLPPVINPQTGSFGPFVTDPRVLWDGDTNKWFISALKIDTNPADGDFLNHAEIVLAVSQTSDGTGAFYQFSIDITDPTFGNCPCVGDQPAIGVNQDALFITTNQFSFSDSTFQTALVLAVDKYALARGTALRSVALQSLQAGEEPGFAIQPARMPPTGQRPLEHGGTEYFVSSLGFPKVRDNRLAVWALTNTSSLRTDQPRLEIQEAVVVTETYSIPNAVPQKSGPRTLSPSEPLELIDTGDNRVEQVYYANGKLFTSLTTGIETDASQAGVAWFVLRPSTDTCPLVATLADQGYVVADDGTSVVFPAFVVDQAGKGLLAFNVTGNDFYPSVGFVEFDGHHIKPPIRIAAAGVGPEDGFSGYASLGGNGTARWGDYSAATLSADGEFWFASGYIPNKPRAVEANWGTFIAHLSLKREQ